MLIEAKSVEDVLTVLQSDPYIVEPIPSKVLIRSLEVTSSAMPDFCFGVRDGGNP